MAVDSICNHNVATIGPEADIVAAAREMREAHVGQLVVTELREGRTTPIGVITDRDIVVGVVAKEAAPDSLKVADVMSSELLTVRDHNGVEFALREMRRVGVRRVPVVGGRHELIGILSMDDVLDHLAAQLSAIADLIRVEQQVETRTRP